MLIFFLITIVVYEDIEIYLVVFVLMFTMNEKVNREMEWLA